MLSRTTRRPLSRRSVLRGAGVALSLPFLDSMLPVFGQNRPAVGAGAKPRRMIAVCNNLGLLADHFFPQSQGRDYALSPCLENLKAHRNDFTVFSGVSHPNVDGGHPADVCFLTAAPHPGSGSFRNTISLDQYIAEQIGTQTRFPSLTLFSVRQKRPGPPPFDGATSLRSVSGSDKHMTEALAPFQLVHPNANPNVAAPAPRRHRASS